MVSKNICRNKLVFWLFLDSHCSKLSNADLSNDMCSLLHFLMYIVMLLVFYSFYNYFGLLHLKVEFIKVGDWGV